MTRRHYRYNQKTKMCEEFGQKCSEAFHFVIDDTRDAFESPVTGQKFDSLSKYKAHIKEHGYEIMGTDTFTGKGLADFSPKDIVNEAEMREAGREEIGKARSNMMPCSERDKEIWKEESKMMKGQSNNLMELKMRGLEEKSRQMGIPVSEMMSKMKRSF